MKVLVFIGLNFVLRVYRLSEEIGRKPESIYKELKFWTARGEWNSEPWNEDRTPVAIQGILAGLKQKWDVKVFIPAGSFDRAGVYSGFSRQERSNIWMGLREWKPTLSLVDFIPEDSFKLITPDLPQAEIEAAIRTGKWAVVVGQKLDSKKSALERVDKP
ncbi:hypothetical protein J7K42_02115 [bacterium]|nr:hypothetical protein [bacterium]